MLTLKSLGNNPSLANAAAQANVLQATPAPAIWRYHVRHNISPELAPIPAPAIGLLAFVALMGLMFVTFAFRSVGTRH